MAMNIYVRTSGKPSLWRNKKIWLAEGAGKPSLWRNKKTWLAEGAGSD